MRPLSYRIVQSFTLLLLVGWSGHTAFSQAPSSIQIFLPGGALPDRAMRFTLTRDDGRIEIVFTDTKGKFLITGDLVRDADYTVRVEGDGRTFATTVATFRTFRNQVVYVPVFLNPLESKKTASGVLNVADADVPAEARADYQRAMQELAKGETDKAINDLKRALTHYPKYLRALNDLGVLFLQMNRLDEAATTFREAIKIDEKFVYPRLNFGIVLIRQRRHVEAAEILKKLLEENPKFAEAEMPYADALAETGKLAEAEKVLRHVLTDPDIKKAANAEAHFRLGAVLNRQNRFDEAVTEFEKAIELEPNTVMAHLQLGGALMQLKRLSQAERELLKAYELGGSSAGAAQFLLGQAYCLELKYEAAIVAFEQYLKDVPNAPNSTEVKEAINKMRSALKGK